MTDRPNIPRTEEDLLRNLFQDGQANNSIGTHEFRDSIVSAKYLNGQAWTFDLDAEFTYPNPPMRIDAGIRTQLTNDAALEQQSSPPSQFDGQDAFWSSTENKIVPNGLNNFGMVRVAMTAESVSASTNNFDIELDVGGGSFPIVWSQTGVFSKGAGNPQNFNFIIPLFSGPDFQENGGKFYITPESDADFWTIAITAVAIYIASPAIPAP